MKKIAIAAVLAFFACPPAGAQNFDAYKVPIYQGARVQPNFTGSQAQFKMFRSAIRFGYPRGQIVAGHYSRVIVGCGTGCSSNYFVDMRNGRIIPLPLGGEFDQEIALDSRLDSSLMIVRWYDMHAGYQRTVCSYRNYVLTDRFEKIGQDVKSTRCNYF